MVRVVVAALLVLHGLIHLFGFAKAFGYADLPLLGSSISEPIGVLWLMAALLCLAAAAALFLVSRWWWVVGALAVVTSQAVIVTAWSDAMIGCVSSSPLAPPVVMNFGSAAGTSGLSIGLG